jgi:SAM-dependent methyltransferase
VDRAHGALGSVLTGSRRDRELEAGTAAHFEDPAYYAQTYGPRQDDVKYYRALAEERGSVLEHGIGNGRVAIAMAEAGATVVGIDASRPMLADLRARLAKLAPAIGKRIVAHHGDIRTKKLGKKFPLVICPFNTALHLYDRDDVEKWLARVKEHLTARGELVFDISMPLAEDLARNPNEAFTLAPFEHPTLGRVKYREHFDYDRVRQILFVSMYFTPTKNPREELMTPLAHRQFYPREMEALLHYNGFKVTALHGDFHRGRLDQHSDVMVWHARAR